ncbi:MAG TPA: SDR family NAD(P)-dependent oxidoreductase [Gemmatimonadales bacterium]|nr:SDR family NAD(P)-dependent oxidoreductase [Gemmatimonadales bacterium]
MSAAVDLAGRAALVTGGSRGIGRATALLLARAGADVALTYRTRAAEAEAVAAEIRALGRRALALGGDLADPARAADVVARAADALGGLDCFVANAGVWPVEAVPLAALSEARWRDTLAANLDAVFLTTRAALGALRDGGAVVLVSSTAGQRGEAFHADYAATKGALIALTKSLAVECAPRFTVNCVAPGWVDTEMVAGAMAGDARRRIEAAIPLGRLASAEDVAGPILFLCSPWARHVTGEILNVNGGSVLCG